MCIRPSSLVVCILAPAILPSPLYADGAAKKPVNIVFILADDLGWTDLTARMPEKAKELHVQLQSWRRQIAAPMPAPNTLRTKRVAKRPPKALTNSIGMKLVPIPAGQFLMGSLPDEEERKDDEDPRHRVRITHPFYLGAHEVTQEQFEKVMGMNPSEFRGPTLPAENVTWNEAVEFCRRLSQKEGRTYRLPTEAEWEYACRAGSTTPFAYGRSLSCKTDANFNAEYAYGGSQTGPYLEKTVPVGSYRANAWGLCDMHGNVWEWCQDWWAADYYARSPTDDPTGPDSGTYRVDRGGAWNVDAAGSRSANRDGCSVDMRDSARGFRVLLVPAIPE